MAFDVRKNIIRAFAMVVCSEVVATEEADVSNKWFLIFQWLLHRHRMPRFFNYIKPGQLKNISLPLTAPRFFRDSLIAGD